MNAKRCENGKQINVFCSFNEDFSEVESNYLQILSLHFSIFFTFLSIINCGTVTLS